MQEAREAQACPGVRRLRASAPRGLKNSLSKIAEISFNPTPVQLKDMLFLNVLHFFIAGNNSSCSAGVENFKKKRFFGADALRTPHFE